MIKNASASLWLLVVAACQASGAAPEPLQGVVEMEERQLAFEVPGQVETVAVVRGDRVEAAAVIAKLDDALQRRARDARAADARAAVAQRDLVLAGSRPEEVRSTSAQLRAAEAVVARVQGELERSRRLAAGGAIGAAQVQDLEADFNRAREEVVSIRERVRQLKVGARREEIELAEARAAGAAASLAAEEERLAHHVLYAPVPGRVLDVHIESGEVVAAGAPIATLGDPRRPYVDVFVPIARLPRVRLGAAAQVRVDGQAQAIPGRVEHIGRETEFTPRYLFSARERPNLVVRVRVRIDDPQERLHAGVPAFLTLQESP